MIALRRPDHRLGWLFIATGLEGTRYQAFLDYGLYALAHPDRATGGRLVAWSQLPTNLIAVALFILLLVWFPTGRATSRWWYWPVWLAGSVAAVMAVAALWAYPDSGWAPLHTPERQVSGLPGWWLEAARYATTVAALGGVAALFARLRSASGAVRRQVKWFAYGAGLTIAVSAVINLPVVRDQFSLSQRIMIAGVMVLAVPIAAVIAVFRYQLWDIDLLLRRSMLYAALTVTIGAVYVGVATTLGVAAAYRLPLWFAALSTVAATLALQPARRWLARTILRRLGGERLSGGVLLRRVGEALEHSHDPAELAPRLARTVRQGLGVEWARFWLDRPPAGDADGIVDARPLTTAGYPSTLRRAQRSPRR